MNGIRFTLTNATAADVRELMVKRLEDNAQRAREASMRVEAKKDKQANSLLAYHLQMEANFWRELELLTEQPEEEKNDKV